MENNNQKKPDVVISGISGQFPLCNNIEEFKENLFKGIDMVTADDARWPVGHQRLPARNGKVYGIEKFDREFFNYSPEETELIDPQERLLLEAVYSAILDAGVNPDKLKGTNTGYFHGGCVVETSKKFDSPETLPQGYAKTVATRIPLFLGIRGPEIEVDSACASGLTALTEAYYAMKSGVCDAAIVTASNTLFRPRIAYQFKDLKMLAMDGKCKCLDMSADGYVRSEAIVAIFLQKASDAKRVHSYILGCKSNSDGFKNEGITYPSFKGQSQVLQETYEEAQVDPADIDYIEAHITGTKAGDPAETTAIYDIIASKRKDPLLVGCLKSNIGHTEGASGLCAIAKACIVHQTSLIPPNIHYNNPNTSLKGLDDGKMKPVADITPFKGKFIPVNCFGFGGTNTHVLTSMVPNNNAKPLKRQLNISLTESHQPPYRLILAPGRTAAGVKFIFDQLLSDNRYLTREYLALLDNFSSIEPRKNGFNERGFAVLHTGETIKSYKVPLTVNSVDLPVPQLVLDFKGPKASTAAAFDDCCKAGLFDLSLAKVYERGLKNLQHKASAADIIIAKSVALQVGVVDLMRKLDVPVSAVHGSSTGELAAAYFDGLLSKEVAIEAAFHTTNGLKEILLPEMDKLSQKTNKWLSSNGTGLISDLCLKESMMRISNGFLFNSRKVDKDSLVVEVGPNVISIKDSNNNDEDLLNNNLTPSPYLNTLITLGKIYSRGINVNVASLFPPVEYPCPPCTPFFSHMVKWDHTLPASAKDFLFEPTDSISFQTTKNIVHRFEAHKADESFVFDHKVNGRSLFPATGYLMIVWDSLAKLNKVIMTEMPVKFEKVKFLRATILSYDAEVALSVRINQDTGAFEVKEGDSPVATGKITAINGIEEKQLMKKTISKGIEECLSKQSNMILGANEIYKELRIRGYDYGPYFQGMIEASADGTKGKVLWRDIVTKNVKDTLAFETEEEHSYFWAKSWCAFIDSMLQLQLINRNSDTRCLLVPTSVESLIVFPDQLKKSIDESPVVNDTLNQNTSSVIDIYHSAETGTVFTEGVVLSGFKASFMARRKQNVKLLQYSFVPFNLNECIDNETSLLLSKYQKALEAVESGKGSSDDGSSGFDLEDGRFALLKNKLKSGVDAEDADISSDLIAGSLGSSHVLNHQLFFKTTLDLAVYNLICGNKSKRTLSVMEVNLHASENDLLISKTEEVLSTHLLSNAYSVEYSLFHRSPSSLAGNATSRYTNTICVDGPLDIAKLPSASLLLVHFSAQMEEEMEKSQMLVNQLVQVMTDGAFALVLCKPSTVDQDSQSKSVAAILDVFKSNGLMFVSKKQLSPLLPYQLLLLRKRSKESHIPVTVVKVGCSDYEKWFDQVKSLIEARESRVLMANNREDPLDGQKVTGLIGMVKSLRLEPGGELVRCFLDFSPNSTSSQEDISTFSDLDLAYAARLDSQFGTYEHIFMADEVTGDSNSQASTDHIYLRSLKQGDLSSLTWVQNQVAHEPKYLKSHVEIHCSGLNFKDVLFATGRLPMDAIPSNASLLTAQDSLLGLEFAGVEAETKKRVMGIVPYKGLATSIATPDEFMWQIPDNWTFEQAATIPVTYSTVLYAFLIRAKIQPRESVLIHAGAGGVGIAAINTALAYNCEIFTTVGSVEKKNFILKEFQGKIPAERILNSRSTQFEEEILKMTNGKGVDIILNSLSDDKFEATLRCLSLNGRFVEIGKVDMLADRNLNLTCQLQANQSFHGVFLDTLAKCSEDNYFSETMVNEKKLLHRIMQDAIQKGLVKPLPHVVFDKAQITDAFRFMTTGKHIGKLVVKMRSEDGSGLTRCIRSTFMSMDKSYLVVGGLGGLGLELVQWLVTRGARHIVISSRRGISTPFQKWTVERLRSEGINVVVSQADCTHEDGAKSLIELANSIAPVGGIFNSAVVYKDCLFHDATVDVFEQVASTKALATINLDKLSRIHCRELDYFVAFSSMSSGRGNEGQTNYNFGNSIMDSICLSRVAQGLPGLSVQWGVIGDVGLVAELHSASSDSNGVVSFSNVPSEIVLLGCTSQRVHSVFETLERILTYKNIGCIASLVPDTGSTTGKESASDLVKVISNLLGLKDLSTLDPSTTLGSLGIDSLIAVEIKQGIERVVGLSLSLKEVRDLTVSRLQELANNRDLS